MKHNPKLATLIATLAASILVPAVPALADETGTVHLTCRPSGSAATVMVEDGPTIIDLNSERSTATVHFPAWSLKYQLSPPSPAQTDRPMHATFGDETVTFDDPSKSAPDGGPDRYVLNRLTGDLSGKWGEDQMNCEAAAKRF